LIVLGRLVRIVGLLLESGPTLFTDQRITILLILLRIIFEESGGGGGLRLVVMTSVSTDILALVEFIVMLHVLLHGLPYWMILVVIHDVGIGYVLCMNTASPFYQWKLLGVKIFVRV